MRKITLLFFSLFVFSAVGSDYMFVQSKQAKMLSEPKLDAPVVATLKQGQRTKIIQHKKRWIQVETQGKTGWISSMLLKNHPPMKKFSVIKQQDNAKQQQNVRKRASSTSSAAAARGFRNQIQDKGKDEKTNYQAVDQMESVTVSPKEVENFSQEKTDQKR